MSRLTMKEHSYGVAKNADLYGAPSPGIPGEHPATPTSREPQSWQSDNIVNQSSRHDCPSLPDYDALGAHYVHLQLLADHIRAARITVSEEEAAITAALKTLRAENADIRPRGLKGGSARKARKITNKYTPIKQMDSQQNERRLFVEKQDQKGRLRLDGVRQLLKVLSEDLECVESQAEPCKRILDGQWMAEHHDKEALAFDMDLTNDILYGEIFQRTQEIQATMEVFESEYGR